MDRGKVLWWFQGNWLSTLTGRDISILQLLVRDMDLDAGLGNELGDLHRLWEYGHISPVLGAQQPIALSKLAAAIT